MAIECTNFVQPQHEREADLIAETLVREIGRNTRWCAKVEAWEALQRVRMVADSMSAEHRHLHGEATAGSLSGGSQA